MNWQVGTDMRGYIKIHRQITRLWAAGSISDLPTSPFLTPFYRPRHVTLLPGPLPRFHLWGHAGHCGTADSEVLSCPTMLLNWWIWSKKVKSTFKVFYRKPCSKRDNVISSLVIWLSSFFCLSDDSKASSNESDEGRHLWLAADRESHQHVLSTVTTVAWNNQRSGLHCFYNEQKSAVKLPCSRTQQFIHLILETNITATTQVSLKLTVILLPQLPDSGITGMGRHTSYLVFTLMGDF